MKISIQLAENDDRVVHACESRREADWIVYTCPECPDYERRLHLPTGKMTVVGTVADGPLHVGSYSPPSLEEGLISPN